MCTSIWAQSQQRHRSGMKCGHYFTSAADTMCFSMKGPYVFGSEGQAGGLVCREACPIDRQVEPAILL